MPAEPTTVEKLRGLPWSVATNATNTVFVQFTFFGSAFVLFLDQLHLSKADIGFILSLIPFSNLVALGVAPAVARFGFKRTFLWFYGARKAVTALLLLTPWVVAHWGSQLAFWFVASVVALFAVFRTVEETAYYPWNQEFVPNFVRGKYAATSNIFTALVGVASVAVAGLVIERSQGLNGFMLLIAVGVLFGFASVWASAHIPGGAPLQGPELEASRKRHLLHALHDGNFVRYLLGLGVMTLGITPLTSFLPLFMEEKVGLSSGSVILLQLGTLVGTLASSYLWGWAADRYGSRPVMLTGAGMIVLLPLFWWAMPRHESWSLYVALLIAFFQGVANLGWGIGAGRLLFVGIVPTDKKNDYLALYFAWAGLVAGASQWIGGQILDGSRDLSGRIWLLDVDAYTPLFVLALGLPLVSVVLLRQVRGDSPVSMGEFAGIFLRGNPFLAMGSLIRFYRAQEEHDAVRVTARLGDAHSPLTVDELLEALADPRFNVRFEAILAIARMPPNPRLTQALVDVLNGKSPALSVIAAWALGRIGDRGALDALRASLNAGYRSIQAHSARSLGTLGDQAMVPELLARLAQESDEGLRVAYASALGKLGARGATRPLLTLLRDCRDEATRMELALAVARLVGQEGRFIRLWRQARGQPGTALSQAVSAVAREWRRHLGQEEPRLAELATCAELFAREELLAAAQALSQLLLQAPATLYDEEILDVLHECGLRLRLCGVRRLEYLLLAVHTLRWGWR
ncbi:MAG: hypothetical protein KatS3mg050_4616 [Litorilinea sp.]|nr:MAG: hypothetical protein KatS3mg050_4616 [Litorilinea sp.]